MKARMRRKSAGRPRCGDPDATGPTPRLQRSGAGASASAGIPVWPKKQRKRKGKACANAKPARQSVDEPQPRSSQLRRRTSIRYAVEDVRTREWLDEPETEWGRWTRLLDESIAVPRGGEASLAKRNVLVDGLKMLGNRRGVPASVRRTARDLHRFLTYSGPSPKVQGRTPSPLSLEARRVLYKDTYARVKPLWIRQYRGRGESLHQALLQEFREDGAQGVPRPDQLQEMTPSRAARFITAARVSTILARRGPEKP